MVQTSPVRMFLAHRLVPALNFAIAASSVMVVLPLRQTANPRLHSNQPVKQLLILEFNLTFVPISVGVFSPEGTFEVVVASIRAMGLERRVVAIDDVDKSLADVVVGLLEL